MSVIIVAMGRSTRVTNRNIDESRESIDRRELRSETNERRKSRIKRTKIGSGRCILRSSSDFQQRSEFVSEASSVQADDDRSEAMMSDKASQLRVEIVKAS